MKRAILLILIGAVIGGAGVWFAKRSGAKSDSAEKAAEKPAEEEEPKTTVTRDAAGHVVINISDETQGDMGLLVAHPAAETIAPELKAYGRVMDPSPLAGLLIESATAQAASAVSANELSRLKTLESQGNASTRALQTAEAAALRDQLAVKSARDRLALSWGKAVAEQNDLPGFIQSLTSLNSALVRLDLPLGSKLDSLPVGARVAALNGQSAEAEFLGLAASADPQTQASGSLFLLKTNSLGVLPGQPIIGYLKLRGEPLTGVIIPRVAVIRTEGAGWVYVQNSGGEAYTRSAIALDHPAEAGWFVRAGLTTNDYIVTTGAQQLLSEEMKGQGGGGE